MNRRGFLGSLAALAGGAAALFKAKDVCQDTPAARSEAQDIQTRRARIENQMFLDCIVPRVMDHDDHSIHLSEHAFFQFSCGMMDSRDLEIHIQNHRLALVEQNFFRSRKGRAP